MSGILGPVGNLLQGALTGLDLKSQILAQNVANLGTPGYQAQDVQFQTTLAQALKTGSVNPVVVPSPGSARTDGNSVNLEQTLGVANQVAVAQQGVMNALDTEFKTIHTVISDFLSPGV